jgi:phospholipase/carboxylesterase
VAPPEGRPLIRESAQGRHDSLIPLARARAARDALVALGCPVEFREYPIGHTVSDAEVRDLATWLAGRMADG